MLLSLLERNGSSEGPAVGGRNNANGGKTSVGGGWSEADLANFLKIVDSMKSDYERSRSLNALLQHSKLGKRNDLRALRNLIGEAQTIIATTNLPEGRSQRAHELLTAAVRLADDLFLPSACSAREGPPRR